MTMQGWIKLHRQLTDNPLWLSEPFTRGQAWVDLIILANHKDGILRVRGNKVNVKRGQVGWSELSLCERWKWSRGKVRRFVKELEKTGNIVQQKNKITSIITVVKYDDYQDVVQQTVQQTDNRQYTNKNVKKEKKTYTEEYDSFWDELLAGERYQKKTQDTKADIFKKYQVVKKKFTDAQIWKVLENENKTQPDQTYRRGLRKLLTIDVFEELVSVKPIESDLERRQRLLNEKSNINEAMPF